MGDEMIRIEIFLNVILVIMWSINFGELRLDVVF